MLTNDLTPAEQLEVDVRREFLLYGQCFLVMDRPAYRTRVLSQSDYDITVTPKGYIAKEKHGTEEAS